ncbi:hypothetical protein OMCYN_01370 [cyanobiont of Ornithocercus magnificus]|nr:hypothetical protein OMCYN_01370 [cyanobiont of Ornithocercus magnificus]
MLIQVVPKSLHKLETTGLTNVYQIIHLVIK